MRRYFNLEGAYFTSEKIEGVAAGCSAIYKAVVCVSLYVDLCCMYFGGGDS